MKYKTWTNVIEKWNDVSKDLLVRKISTETTQTRAV